MTTETIILGIIGAFVGLPLLWLVATMVLSLPWAGPLGGG